MTRLVVVTLCVAGLGLAALPVAAATCRDQGGFGAFIASIKKEAAAQGISPLAISALNNVSFDPGIISKDHGQGIFSQSFERFSGRLINPGRLRRGANLLKQNASLFSRIEQVYGVPGPVLVAIWGLETGFGARNGSSPTLKALATLAFDCRRTDKFQAELLDALRLLQRGDLPLSAMRGDWAGELGQTQFMPSSYLKYAVDFGGGRNLIRSAPDALASTANYLRGYGWRPGAGWEPGQPNFVVLKEWNAADVYARTIALFATKLAATNQGAPR
jgi:lytic murein transglycosylase